MKNGFCGEEFFLTAEGLQLVPFTDNRKQEEGWKVYLTGGHLLFPEQEEDQCLYGFSAFLMRIFSDPEQNRIREVCSSIVEQFLIRGEITDPERVCLHAFLQPGGVKRHMERLEQIRKQRTGLRDSAAEYLFLCNNYEPENIRVRKFFRSLWKGGFAEEELRRICSMWDRIHGHHIEKKQPVDIQELLFAFLLERYHYLRYAEREDACRCTLK